MHVQPHHTVEQLEQLEKGEEEVGRRRRLRVLILAKQAWTAPEIVAAVGLSRRSVQRVVEQYNHRQLAALDDKPGRGRKARLSAEQSERFCRRLDAGPTPQEGVCTFTGKHLQGVLEKEFGVLYKLSAVYKLLHRCGYSWLMPRPQHEESDPAAQEEFKKKSAPS